MLRSFFGNLIFAIIAQMLCGNHLNSHEYGHLHIVQNLSDESSREEFIFLMLLKFTGILNFLMLTFL